MAKGNAIKTLDSIELRNVVVTGIEFAKLMDLKIHHEPNSHAQASLVGMMEKEKAEKFMQQVDLKTVIKIEGKGGKRNAERQTLFQGCITSVQMKASNMGLNQLLVILADVSIQLDIKRESRSFQVLTKKYEEILKVIYKTETEGKIIMNVKDKAIEKFILQLDETNWAFTKRMASHFYAPLITDLAADKPVISIGLRKENQEVKYSVPFLFMSMSEQSYQVMTKNELDKETKAIREDFTSCQLSIWNYLYLGDVVQVGKKKYYVRQVDTSVQNKHLINHYVLVPQNGFLVPRIPHYACQGRLMKGQVQKVEKDKVQVHFLDIDEKYDTASTAWFPFATVYSSSDGSGWYVMPEEKDYVRMMFPSADASEAYAASSINMVPMEKVKDKSFKAPGGREILLTEDTIEIICDHQKIFVNLSKKDGISIVSAQDINVSADGNISLDAKGKVQLLAKDEIELQSGSAHVKIKSDHVAMGGSSVLVGE